MNFKLVGKKAATVVLGKKSGRHSVLLKAWEFGLPMPSEEQASEMVVQMKRLSEEKKRWLSEEEFKNIYYQVMGATS